METLVNAQRFAQGLEYAQYLAQMKANREQFERNYQESRLSPDDEKYFSGINERLGPIKVLALGEDWCPDVQRGLPIMSKIAERAGMDLRVFPRDNNMDLMNQYLKEGKYTSIPVFAFFGQDWKPLGYWIERPAMATKFISEIKEKLVEFNLTEEETKLELRKRMAPIWDNVRMETVRELRELLAKAATF